MGVLMALGALSDLYFKFGLRGRPQQQSILILKFSVIQKPALNLTGRRLFSLSRRAPGSGWQRFTTVCRG